MRKIKIGNINVTIIANEPSKEAMDEFNRQLNKAVHSE